MNKCKEAFERHLAETGGFVTATRYSYWQAAWNAALEHAANVCDAAAFGSSEPMRYMECAEEIRKEKTE